MADNIPSLIPGAITVAVTSGKGGVGKTTLTCALAAALSRKGVDVTVIDGDVAGPNVHLVSAMEDVSLAARTDPLTLQLPRSPHGFAVATPMSLPQNGSTSIGSLAAMVQYAAVPDVVLIDLPPGWTSEHSSCVAMLPQLVISVVAPTPAALSDHDRHVQAWQQSWQRTLDRIRNSDKRRRWTELPAAANIVAVETMASFVGVATDGRCAGEQLTVRRSDAVDAATMRAQAATAVSVPAGLSLADIASDASVAQLADMVLALREAASQTES